MLDADVKDLMSCLLLALASGVGASLVLGLFVMLVAGG